MWWNFQGTCTGGEEHTFAAAVVLRRLVMAGDTAKGVAAGEESRGGVAAGTRGPHSWLSQQRC